MSTHELTHTKAARAAFNAGDVLGCTCPGECPFSQQRRQCTPWMLPHAKAQFIGTNGQEGPVDLKHNFQDTCSKVSHLIC